MTTVHIVLGVAVVVVNLAAGLLGAYKWRKDEYSHAFWPILRTGQALVVIEALDGAVLLLMGQELPRLHLIDQRGVSSARELDPDDAEDAALDILRREMGVMAASALVVAALGLRAGGVL